MTPNLSKAQIKSDLFSSSSSFCACLHAQISSISSDRRYVMIIVCHVRKRVKNRYTLKKTKCFLSTVIIILWMDPNVECENVKMYWLLKNIRIVNELESVIRQWNPYMNLPIEHGCMTVKYTFYYIDIILCDVCDAIYMYFHGNIWCSLLPETRSQQTNFHKSVPFIFSPFKSSDSISLSCFVIFVFAHFCFTFIFFFLHFQFRIVQKCWIFIAIIYSMAWFEIAYAFFHLYTAGCSNVLFGFIIYT